MCGIAGNSFGDVSKASTMLDRLKHRGPDGRGIITIGSTVHGHVRLSLVDLTEASAQPFQRNKTVLSFNGEIWNYKELRAELTSVGELFTTTGDTEVLAALLGKYGIAGLNKADGMFAFAWSSNAETWLVRDGRGKIPLYVRKEETGWSWASERKAFGYGGQVEALAPGTALNVTTGESVVWFNDEQKVAFDSSAVLDCLRVGVRKRLAADAPVCCLISGGMDSAMVLALALETSKSVTAFTAYFDDRSEDLKSARRLCSEWGVKLVEVKAEADKENYVAALSAIEISSKAQIEIAVLCLPLAEAIQCHGFKACLSGEAADELFGGYGNFCIKASKADDATIAELRLAQVRKMARGNFIRCNKVFMAHGVECRLPFMEENLVQMVTSATKAQNPPGKKLLKQAAEKILPRWVISRQKETFQGAGGTAAAAELLFKSPKQFYNSELKARFGIIPKD